MDRPRPPRAQPRAVPVAPRQLLCLARGRSRLTARGASPQRRFNVLLKPFAAERKVAIGGVANLAEHPPVQLGLEESPVGLPAKHVAAAQAKVVIMGLDDAARLPSAFAL